MVSLPFAHLFPSLQVPDMLQQWAGGRLSEPLLRVRAGPGVAVLLLSLQQEMSLLLLVSLAAERKPGDAWGCRGAWEGAVWSLFLTADKPGPSRRSLEGSRQQWKETDAQHSRKAGATFPLGGTSRLISQCLYTPLLAGKNPTNHRTKRSLVQSYTAFHGGHPCRWDVLTPEAVLSPSTTITSHRSLGCWTCPGAAFSLVTGPSSKHSQ